jgi:hypothetical protein
MLPYFNPIKHVLLTNPKYLLYRYYIHATGAAHTALQCKQSRASYVSWEAAHLENEGVPWKRRKQTQQELTGARLNKCLATCQAQIGRVKLEASVKHPSGKISHGPE